MSGSLPLRGLTRVLAKIHASVLILSIGGCRNERTTVQQPRHDIYRLSTRVNLLEKPRSVSYKIAPSGKGDGIFGPTDYQLVAVLEYDQASLQRLRARATRLNMDVRSIWLPDRPEWFPPAVFAAIHRCSDTWCISGEEYSATEFLKGGFVTGTFIIPDSQDYAILLLRT